MGFLEDTVETLPVLLNGTVIAVELFAIVLVLSLPLGLPIAFGENNKIGIIRWLCRAYVFVFRGTPLLLQLFFFYYFFPIALHVQMSALEPDSDPRPERSEPGHIGFGACQRRANWYNRGGGGARITAPPGCLFW